MRTLIAVLKADAAAAAHTANGLRKVLPKHCEDDFEVISECLEDIDHHLTRAEGIFKDPWADISLATDDMQDGPAALQKLHGHLNVMVSAALKDISEEEEQKEEDTRDNALLGFT